MSGLIGNNAGLAGILYAASVRPRVFISYHHARDQYYYNAISFFFADQREVFHDASLDRRVDSDNIDYVRWRVRDDYIRGTSCTVVLCGAETPQRKFVDWEIKATLDMEHGLVAIGLPTAIRGQSGTIVPDRVHENVLSGYAVWVPDWNLLTPQSLATAIADARQRSETRKQYIQNWRELKMRNG